MEPEYVIVIDDGSTDNTRDVLASIQADWSKMHVITNLDMGYDVRRIVTNWNKALTYADVTGLGSTDYHLIATDDTVYSDDYAEKMLNHMAGTNIVIACGIYDKHVSRPHGAGRFVRNDFFKQYHGRYPEKMGYESMILHSAEMHGYLCAVFDDARFSHTRPLGKNHHFYEFGASMRTLGYHPFFALGRVAKYFVTGTPVGRIGALRMLYCYLVYTPKDRGYDSMHDSDMRDFIRRSQVKRITNLLLGSKENPSST